MLGAAERVFAGHGYTAASVRDITAAAHCNLAAVNYYFGGKQGLYEALFRNRLCAMRQQRVESVAAAMARARGGPTLNLLLGAFADAFLEPLIEEGRGRHLLSLLSREMLDPRLPGELFESEMVAPVHDALADALVRLTPGLTRNAASRCVVSIIGQLVQVAHRCHWAAAASGRHVRPRLPRMVEHIVHFSAAGVRACAKGRR